MLERCFGGRRLLKVKRLLRNGKLTLLCLALTVVVIRGYLGAGKFGTPQQDFREIRNRFSRRQAEPRRVLEEAGAGAGAAAEEKRSYGDVDIKTIWIDEDEEPERSDPNRPYTLGPKISDWDERRARWLKKNPNCPNFLRPDKPRVLLATGSSPKPCENPVGDHYLLKALKNKIDYCRLHGIEIFYNMALLDAEMAGFWAKLPLIRKLLISHPDIEFLWWMDSDAMFTDMAFEIPWERYRDSNFVMHGWDHMVYGQKNWIGLNTGSFLLRNCQWSLDILDAWAPMGPLKVREEAGKMLARELKDRPPFEADDQSAIVYLLVKEKDKWADKVYLESAYYLHGYWGILVDRFEEMMENYHPGLGDHRWPLVTHFVGCKPCGKFGDYPVERCLKQMDRAFNFADNQVLQIYGFMHKSLDNRKVKRTRNETDKPLEIKDKFGLIHPAFKAVKVSSS
ncbi:xyloglucan 6-xylosyltransferase 2-like [Diospyros lotus]|uniref:xyloglucan 6-xylosyltransferase 2-like n=1 Tax=Diospyros lotus TaxID=55363 RepID=UPI002252BA25|nr:xyloglucan 6-xylosyltransferase 2-like [Diospyros lotus]